MNTEGGGLKPGSEKYLKGIIGCIIAGVVLYSPIGLHLRFSDPGVIRGGLSLAFCVLLAVLMVWSVSGFIKAQGYGKGTADGKPAKKNGPADPAEKDWTSAEALKQLEGIPCSPVSKTLLADAAPRLFTGKIARQALEQGKTAVQKAASFREVVGRKFVEGSLTYARYTGTIDQCMEIFGKNLEALSWQVKNFDEKEYDRLTRVISSGSYTKDQIDDRVQEDRLLTLSGHLEDMRHILDLNEQMILQLDGCAREVALLEGAENDKENEIILEEIRNLMETTKYYK